MSETGPDSGEVACDTISNANCNLLSRFPNIQRDSAKAALTNTMPSVVSHEPYQEDENHETVFKIEPGTEIVTIDASPGHETSQFGSDGRTDHSTFMGEEPLEIQCGENSALLYVSKLCQGSKGPCILFNNEWLTPNELQYISGRETAKDWKRSIRFKGKSLKSLIARGLIKVHPPICDCLGCRISSPVNRGRLASKCGVAPPSPRSRKRDASKSFSCWNHDELEGATTHRHFSTSDLDNFPRHVVNGFRDTRPGSYSSTASESSDAHDESPFSPVTKRSGTPELSSDERPRLPVPHYSSHKEDYEKALSIQRMIQLNQQQDREVPTEQSEENESESNKTRSAFRTVQQDTLTSMTPTATDNDVKDMSSRTAKMKSKNGAPTPPFLPPYTQYPTGPSMVSPTSPRLVPDPLMFGNPHGANLYHHAFRGGFHGVPQLPRNLMQYRLLTPPGTGTTPQSPLAGLSLQGQLQMMQDLAAVNGAKMYDKKRLAEENGISHKRRRSSNEHSDDRSNNSVFSDDDASSPRKENGHHSDKGNHVSVIHKSPVNSPLTIDVGSDVKTRTESSPSKAHRLIPKLKLNTDENILNWDGEQVCEFIFSLTGSSEVVNEFKEQCIDGQSLILLKEEHLLNKLGIKLGPALKILAHIQKILERVGTEDCVTDANDSG